MLVIFSGLVFVLALGVLLVKETSHKGTWELLMFNLNRKYSWVALEQYFKLGWM